MTGFFVGSTDGAGDDVKNGDSVADDVARQGFVIIHKVRVSSIEEDARCVFLFPFTKYR